VSDTPIWLEKMIARGLKWNGISERNTGSATISPYSPKILPYLPVRGAERISDSLWKSGKVALSDLTQIGKSHQRLPLEKLVS
jgi:hypothetical protein